MGNVCRTICRWLHQLFYSEDDHQENWRLLNNERNNFQNEGRKSLHTGVPREVQVLIPVPSDATANFATQFYDRLQRYYGIRAIETDVDAFNADVTSTDDVWVICHHHSRLESNVTNSLNAIKNNKRKLILIVVHIETLENLPKSSSKSELEGVLPFNIKDILDIAFYRHMGIYNCYMNKRAFQTIETLM